jgi:hypothetical protein
LAASRSSAAALALALVGWLGVARPARADEEVVLKRGQFHEDGKSLSVTVGFREMLDASARARLKNGFATTVVMRVYLYLKTGGPPVAFTARTLRAVYDLWDEQFILKLEEPGRTRHLRLRDPRQVVDLLTSTWRLPLARLEQVKPGAQYFVALIAEVNPMSEALLEEVRRWLRTPYGDHRRPGGESFFGSFVSIFVNNKIRSAEKTFRLRTQPFYRR